MPKIDFFVSVDGSAPRPIDLDKIAGLISVISGLESSSGYSEQAKNEPTLFTHTPTTAHKRRMFPVTKPPMGKRAIDYATKAALSFNGEPFALAELRDRMLDLGWTTRSKSKRDQANTVRSTIKDRDDFLYDTETGYWSFKIEEE